MAGRILLGPWSGGGFYENLGIIVISAILEISSRMNMGLWNRSFGKLVSLAVAAVLSGCASGVDEPPNTTLVPDQERFDWETLSPEVVDYIKHNYLAHRAEFPDADEPVSALRAFVDGQELLERGNVEGALVLFQRAVSETPGSRHAQAGLGRALLRDYERSGNRDALARAADALLKAHQLGLRNNRLRYTDELAVVLGELKDTERLAKMFEPLVANAPSDWMVSLDYAAGLERAGSERAGQWYAHSARVRPDDEPSPAVAYARWLLARDMAAEAFIVLEPRPGEDSSIVHFFRGVAAERMGNVERARVEYQGAVGFSDLYPLGSMWRSELAAGVGVHFDDEVRPRTHCAGYTKLSEILYCEARGEGTGGMRAVGWDVRTRVGRGAEKAGGALGNSGATTCERYYNVGMQSGQFYKCGARDAASDSVAYDIYFGRVHPSKTCGNGYIDNCFYRVQ
jgi:hypothetical protein